MKRQGKEEEIETVDDRTEESEVATTISAAEAEIDRTSTSGAERANGTGSIVADSRLANLLKSKLKT